MLFSRSFIESEIWSVLVFWIHRISNLGKRSACVGRRRCTDYPSDWCSLGMLHVKFKGGVVVSVGGVCKTVEGFPLLKRAISYSWELDGKLKQMSSNQRLQGTESSPPPNECYHRLMCNLENPISRPGDTRVTNRPYFMGGGRDSLFQLRWLDQIIIS